MNASCVKLYCAPAFQPHVALKVIGSRGILGPAQAAPTCFCFVAPLLRVVKRAWHNSPEYQVKARPRRSILNVWRGYGNSRAKDLQLKLSQIDEPAQGIAVTDIEAALAQLPQIESHSSQESGSAAAKSEKAEEVAATEEPGQPVHHVRVNNSFLATHERNALLWLAARTPSAVGPDHLTLLGLAGAFLVLTGFAASRVSPWFVSLAILGLFLNWLGDSLDGTLARYRKIERPDFGYFLDHSCDLISQTFIFVGLGLSPYFTLFSALLALSMYLLMSSFTYLKVLILKTHHLSYYGMGATELRLLLTAWTVFALWCGPELIDARFMGLRRIDVTIFALWSLVLLAFIGKVWSDIRRLRPILDK